MSDAAPSRPVLRWHGGKWRLAPWIISTFPPHQVYVEPFGGAASVLLQKQRAYAEVYNDLDEDVVNLFRVLRSDNAEDLRAALTLTPYSRVEFESAYSDTADPVERARRTIVRAFMGFGAHGALGMSTGFRADCKRAGSTPAGDWRGFPDALSEIIKRLSGVTIESRPALDVIHAHDGHDTLFYLDPPYLHETRSPRHRNNYRHEMTDNDHRDLLAALRGLRGRVVMSGYESDMYADALPGWRRIQRESFADGARKRTEVLWLNFDHVADSAGPLINLMRGAST